MKTTVTLCMLLFFAGARVAAAAKPNVLLIYTDDHGWADLGAQGVDADIRTPHLDQLAKDGVRFSRGYVSAPQCAPSRAGVLTGRYQQRFGFEDNSKGPLPLAELTIAERLKGAGYLTGMAGKWHLDLGGGRGEKGMRLQRDHMPHGQGFDEYWRGDMRQYFASHDLKGQPFADAPHLVTDERFRISVQTEAALSFLDRRAAKPDQPWFLYLAWFAPHVPLESAEPWFSKTPAGLPLERRQALAMIAAMDDGLGQIRAKLRAMSSEKSTLIFFIGDNGAPTKKGAWNGSVNVPLIGEKGMLTDGGIRTPFVAAWPGTLPAGQVYELPVLSLDVAATAAAVAGLPQDPKLDGVNLLPFVTGANKSPPHEALYWRWRSQAAILEFPYKLIRLGADERFLFDVTTPEGEKRNLLAEHEDVAARLEAKLKVWCDTLLPPGLPTTVVGEDAKFFADHIDPRFAALVPQGAKKQADAPGSAQGWLCRNGSLQLKGGALVILPDPKAAPSARPFLARAELDLEGPVTATLNLRAAQGGPATLTWRTREQPDFVSSNAVAFEWPASSEWKEIKVPVPVQGRLIHVRLTPSSGSRGAEVRTLTFTPANGKPKRFDFTEAKPKP